MTHLSTTFCDGAKQDLQLFVETFFRADTCTDDDDTKPTILFSAFFEIPSSTKDADLSNQSGPIYTCSGPFMELDYEESIRQTKNLYEKMYPNDEFLPKAPEPEEIIIGDEDGADGTVNLGALADLVAETEKIETKTDNSQIKEAENAILF